MSGGSRDTPSDPRPLSGSRRTTRGNAATPDNLRGAPLVVRRRHRGGGGGSNEEVLWEGEYDADDRGALQLELEEELEDGRRITWVIDLKDPPGGKNPTSGPRVQVKQELENGGHILWASDEEGLPLKRKRHK